MITQEELRAILTYDPKTGLWLWNYRADCGAPWNGRFAGKSAGTINVHGRRAIKIGAKVYLSSRLAWIYMTGSVPIEVDHANRVRSDDRWDNLRPTNVSLNHANAKLPSTSTTGFKGVRERKGRFHAQIKVRQKYLHLGIFDTPEAAHAAYLVAAQQHFGEFACGG